MVLEATNRNYGLPVGIARTTNLYWPGEFLLGRVTNLWDQDLSNLPPFCVEDAHAVTRHFTQRLPYFSTLAPIRTVTGFDLYTDTLMGKVQFSKHAANCLLVTGWSGQGFKMAPEAARRACNFFYGLDL